MGAGRDGDRDTSTDSGGNFGNDAAADNNQTGGNGGSWGGGASSWSGDMQDHLGGWGSTAGPLGYGRTSLGSLFDQFSLSSLFGEPSYGYGPDYADVQGAYSHATKQGHLSDLASLDRARSGQLSQSISSGLDMGTVNLDQSGMPQMNQPRALGLSLGALGRMGFSGPGLGLGRSLGNVMEASRTYSALRESGLVESPESAEFSADMADSGTSRSQRMTLRDLLSRSRSRYQPNQYSAFPVRMPRYGG